MPIVVLGSVNTDLVIRGPKLPHPGETVLGGQFFQASGGKGANQAVAAARAGRQKVVFLAAVGDDPFGRQSLASLSDEGLECRWIHVAPQTATGVALILVDRQGENLISVASGANLALTPEIVDGLPDEAFAGGGVFLASLESPLASVQRGLERARQAGMRTVLNPAPAVAPNDARHLLPLADVLTPNEHEAAALAQLPVDSIDSAKAAALKLQAAGATNVVMTLGSQGCLVVADKTAVHLPPLNVQAVDATAAGDAFSGALAVALAEGMPLVDAARFATAAAGIAVTRAGAQPSLPRREEIDLALSRGTMSYE